MDTTPQSAFDRYYERVESLLKNPNTDPETKLEILNTLNSILDREAE